MPYPAGHREQVRARIVRCARRLFNRKGFESTSVDAIMAEAGLTRGGFYSYFDSKEELYAEAIRYIVAEMPAENCCETNSGPSASEIVKSIVNAYLADAQIDDVDAQCPLISQANDVARSGKVAKAAYRDVFLFMLETLAKALSGSGQHDPDMPYALSAMLVGSMTLARTVGDEQLGRRIRDASRREALRLAQPRSGAGKLRDGVARRTNGRNPRTERAAHVDA